MAKVTAHIARGRRLVLGVFLTAVMSVLGTAAALIVYVIEMADIG